MICISYMGEEAFDIILYLSRTLTKLNHRVLIIDLSETKALLRAISHGMGLDSNQDIVSYRDINYTRKLPSDNELEEFDAGVVIVSYGNHYQEAVNLPCKELNVIVNTFPHVLERISQSMSSERFHAESIHIIIRDIVTIDDVDNVKGSVGFPFYEDKDNYLYLDVSDYECAVHLQVKQIVKFTNISNQMKKYIIMHIHRLFPELRVSQIKKALKKARRGR